MCINSKATVWHKNIFQTSESHLRPGVEVSLMPKIPTLIWKSIIKLCRPRCFPFQCNFEVLLYASKIYKFGLQLFYNFFFSFSIVGFNFLPFVQSSKLDLQCMDIHSPGLHWDASMYGVSQSIYKKKSETFEVWKTQPQIEVCNSKL
jgi:hypothetical protein